MRANSALAKQPAFDKGKRILPVLVAGVLLALNPLNVNADNSNGGDSEVRQLTTENGHKFWYYPMPQANRTAVAVTWKQEVPVDEATHPGTARLGIEVMLNGGAGDRDAAQIVADYQDLDSGSGLWVQPGYVAGFIVAPDQHLSTAREIAHQVLTEPRLEQRWFDREQQKLIESERENGSNSWGIAWDVVREVLLADHPYKNFWSLSPTDELDSITLNDITQWHKNSFSSKSAIVAIAGSASPEVAAAELDQLLAGMPNTAPGKPIEFKQPVAPAKTILLHNPDAPKTVVTIVGNLPAHNESTNLPLQLSVGVLGYGKQSRLFKTVRAGLGASYGFGAGIFDFTRAYRMLEMSGEIETSQLSEAMKEIEQAYEKFRQSGIGRLEFPVATRILKRETAKQLQNPVNMAFTVSEAVQNDFSTTYVESLSERIEKLTRKDTNEIISASFPEFSALTKVIVSPDRDAISDACIIEKIEQVAGCLK
jgi:predicted Zn-dependent peptidase